MGGCSKPSDQERFVTLLVCHQSALHSYVLSLVPFLGDAEEILQEASLKMWRKFDQYQEGTSFRNWAFQIAKYETLNYRRKLSRDRHLFNDELLNRLAADAAESASQLEAERRAALPRCIEKLRDTDREVLSRCYEEKASISRYATSVGKTPNAISRQLCRIRLALLECITNALKSEGA